MHLDFTLISLNFLHFLYVLLLFIKYCSISNCCFYIITKREQKKHIQKYGGHEGC